MKRDAQRPDRIDADQNSQRQFGEGGPESAQPVSGPESEDHGHGHGGADAANSNTELGLEDPRGGEQNDQSKPTDVSGNGRDPASAGEFEADDKTCDENGRAGGQLDGSNDIICVHREICFETRVARFSTSSSSAHPELPSAACSRSWASFHRGLACLSFSFPFRASRKRRSRRSFPGEARIQSSFSSNLRVRVKVVLSIARSSAKSA